MVASEQIDEWVRELAKLSRDGVTCRELALLYRRNAQRWPTAKRIRKYERWRTEWLSNRSQRRLLERKIAKARGEN